MPVSYSKPYLDAYLCCVTDRVVDVVRGLADCSPGAFTIRAAVGPVKVGRVVEFSILGAQGRLVGDFHFGMWWLKEKDIYIYIKAKHRRRRSR
jgi:hypothetical protein